MKALVYHKPKGVRVEKVDDPEIREGTDAVVRVAGTAVCGSDLHIYNGMFPQAEDLVLGQEVHGSRRGDGCGREESQAGGPCRRPLPHRRRHLPVLQQGPHHPVRKLESRRYGPEGGLLTQKGGGIHGYTGLYGGYDNFPLGRLFGKGLSVTMGQALVHGDIDELLALVMDGKIMPEQIITRTFSFDEAAHGYEIVNE